MYRVVIVDDERLIRQGLAKLINWEELGIEVAGEASNGADALALIGKVNPHIIICDIKMPVMNGLELLKKLREDGNMIKFIILSGYDNFGYVKEAMNYKVENYLLKPVNKEELGSTLLNIVDTLSKNLLSKIRMRENTDIFKTNILNRMVNNQISITELKDKLDFLKIDLSHCCYQTAVIEMLNLNNQISKDDIGWKSFAILNISSEILAQYESNICFSDVSGNVVILFFGINDENIHLAKLDLILKECLENIIKFLPLEVLITVGRIVDSLDIVHLSYVDCFKMMDYKYLMLKNDIVYYISDSIKNNLNIKINVDFDRFENYLSICSKDKVYKFLDDICAQFVTTQCMKPQDIRNKYIELVVSLVSVVKTLKLDILDIFFSQDILSGISSCETADELNNWMKNLCTKVIDLLNEKKQKPKSKLDEIIDFINENYTSEISIKTLSAHFKVNSAYLGQLFKVEVNDIFTDYLNKLRVENAKRLLLNTQSTASEISKKVGYNDSNYFYKIFKKYTGVFPSEFRSNEN